MDRIALIFPYLIIFHSQGFGICPALDGHADAYVGNTLYLANDGGYGGGQACMGQTGETTVGGNTIYSPKGQITECGMSLEAYQAKGGDPGTVAMPYPDDSVILALAKKTLQMSA